MRNKGKTSQSLLANNFFVLFISFVIALIIWAVVSARISDETEKTFKINVPAQFSSIKEEYNLDSYCAKEIEVTVTVKGQRYYVEKDKAENNITVEINSSNVANSGTQTLPISVEIADDYKDNMSVVSYSPTEIEVLFDTQLKKQIDVDVRTEGRFGDNIAPEGYIVGEPRLSCDKTIVISGPESCVRKIRSATATVNVDRQITDTEIYKANMEFDSDVAVDNISCDVDFNDVKVSVPVYKVLEMNTGVEFIGFASGTAPRYSISPSSARFGIHESRLMNLEDLSSLYIKTIYSKEINSGKNEFVVTQDDLSDIILPDGEQFTITVDAGAYSTETKSVSVGRSSFANVPAGVNVNLVSDSIEDVVVVGTASDLKNISDGDISVSVDLSSVNTAPGMKKVPADVFIETSSGCWIYGEYEVEVEISAQ